MIRSLHIEMANALAFSEAMTGEFLIASDPLKQKHTLGRIALATLRNAADDEESNEFTMASIFSSSYHLPWAPGVVANVLCYGDRNSGVTNLLKVELEREPSSPDPDYLAVIKVDNPPTQGSGMRLVRAGNEESYSLYLEGDLLIARDEVAEAARQFFDNVPRL